MNSEKLAKMVREEMKSAYDPGGSYTGMPEDDEITRDVDDF